MAGNGQAARCTPDSLSGLEPTEMAQASRLSIRGLCRWLTTMSFDPERFEDSTDVVNARKLQKNQCQPSWNYCFKQFVSNGQAARCTPDSLPGLEPTEMAQAGSGTSGHWRQISFQTDKKISMNRMIHKNVLAYKLKLKLLQINQLINNHVQS
jgi:hypothetical protein